MALSTFLGNNSTRKKRIVIEFAIVLVLSSYTILGWLHQIGLSPDSSNYITASLNLVKTGTLFVFANWPSKSMEPVVEPFSYYAPGLPLYLAPFIIIFKDPIVSAVVAYSLLILIFYMTVFLFTLALDFNPFLRLATLLIFTFFYTFTNVYGNFWTEPLFISLSLGVGFCAIKMIRNGYRTKYWITAFILLFLATLVKYIGIANIAWFIPIFITWPWITKAMMWLSDKVVQIVTQMVRLILMLYGIVMLVLSVSWGAVLIGWDSIDKRIILAAIGILLFLAGLKLRLLTLNRGHCEQKEEERIAVSPSVLFGGGVLIFAVVPIILWFLRNRFLYGEFAQLHTLFVRFYAENLLVPFQFFYEQFLNNRLVPNILLIPILVAIVLMPFRFNNNNQQRIIHLSVFCAMISHFMVLWLPSLIAFFNALNNNTRLLSPTIALGVLALINGLNIWYNQNQFRKVKHLIIAIPFLLLLLSSNTDFYRSSLKIGKLNYPIEMYLWQRIHKLDWTLTSSHFYTDYDFTHQIFAGIPQRIIWDKSILESPLTVEQLLSKGQKPFFLFSEGSEEAKIIENDIQNGKLSLHVVKFPDLKFTLYYRSP